MFKGHNLFGFACVNLQKQDITSDCYIKISVLSSIYNESLLNPTLIRWTKRNEFDGYVERSERSYELSRSFFSPPNPNLNVC